MASGATCVQKLDGSRDSAIHTKYRILLRSSSMREPRYPLPRVVCDFKEAASCMHTANGTKQDASFSYVVFLGTFRAGGGYVSGMTSMTTRMGHHERKPGGWQGSGPRSVTPSPRCWYKFTGRSALQGSTMILPQVHLRKPCYDFSFL
jgi:hypothetical protein